MEQGEVLWGRKPLQRSARDPDDVDWIYVDSLALVVTDDEVARAHLGEPAARACPSGGEGGPFDAWILTCACGLELFVTTRHRDPGAWWIGANDPDIDHALHHLALPGTVTWRHDESPWEVLPLRVDPWVLRRYDDNGQHFEVHRFASRMAAECSLRTFEARGHRQTYVIEPAVAGHSPSSVRSLAASASARARSNPRR